MTKTSVHRLDLTLIVSVLAGAVSLASMVGLHSPRPLGLIVIIFWLAVPGSLALRVLPASGVLGAVLAPAISITALIVVSSASLAAATATHATLWHPAHVTVAIAAACALLAWRTQGLRPANTAPTLTATEVPKASGAATKSSTVLLIVAAASWIISLPFVDQPEGRRFGLLLSGPPTFAVAIVATIVAFAIAVRNQHRLSLWLALGLMVLIQRGTAPLVLDVPAIDWSYKHLGVVELFSRTGTLHPGVDIYQGWPGFFSSIAWLQSASGISAVTLATWFTLVITAGTTAAVYALGRTLGIGATSSLTAAMLALCVNWVAQDYFSPQAVALFLALAILALLARVPVTRSQSWLAAIIFIGLAITHQLTPVWILGTVAVFAIFKKVPWKLVAAMSVIMVLQVAVNFDIIQDYGLFTGVNVLNNAQTTAAADVGSTELTVHAIANRIATLTLWVTAAAIMVLSLRKRGIKNWLASRDAFLAVIAFSPFGILLAQNYGGEALLRVMLYTVPGCALIVGPWLARRLSGTAVHQALGSVMGLVMVLCAAQAYFSTFHHYAVTRAEYDMEVLLERHAPGKVYLNAASPYWPVRATERYADRLAEDAEYDAALNQHLTGLGTSGYLADLEAHLENRDSVSFIFFGPRMDDYAAYRGLAPRGAVNALRNVLQGRAGWELFAQQDGLTVMRYVPRQAVDQPAASWQP